MQKINIQAHAKLNLTLDITGVAPNGYHTLDMVMHTVSLCDTVTLEAADTLSLECPAWLPQGQGNIVWRAAELLRGMAGVRYGAHIQIDKNIPSEAGMGGGSADAAAALKGLNELWGLGLSPSELRGIGLKLGSDVPFALAGGTARVRGVGDEITPIMGVPILWFALAKGAGGVGTADAYRLYDAVGAGVRPQTERFLSALLCGDAGAMAQAGGNALGKAAVALLPAIGPMIDAIRAAGAGYAAMTGSGAAVFGVFASEKEASYALSGIDAPWKAVARSL